MLCERCQQQEATVHLTEKYGPSRDEIASTTERHLCKGCGEDYQGESRRYLDQQWPRLAKMSRAERAVALEKLREDVSKHMTDWILRR
jgi:protein-arginine kinase activator protein McsA